MIKIKAAIAGILSLFAVVSALAQSAPATLPYHTVYGRIGATPGDTGPGQAIPFATLLSQIGAVGVTLPVVSGHAAIFDGTLGKIADSGTTIRTSLTTPVTLYVNPSATTPALCNGASGGIGSDTTGSGTLAAPYQTGNKALDTAARNYDVRLSQITIQYCDNNVTGAVYSIYNQQFNLVGAMSGGNAASAQLIIQGNSSTPNNVQVQGAAGGSAFTFVGVTSPVAINNMQIGSTLIGGATTGHGIQSDAHSMVYYSNITWGFIVTSHSHMVATYDSFIEQEGVERIIGGAAVHWFGDRASQLLTTGFTVTCTGTPAFGSSFVALFNGSNFNLSGATFSGCGGVTGTKYLADYTTSFGAGTADPNTLYPGNANGTVALPSFGLTGLIVGNGGSLTGNAPTTAMPAMNGNCTIVLATGVITCAIPIANVTGLAAGVGTFLATPSSANLAAAVTNEAGTGSLAFTTESTWTPAVLAAGTAGTPAYTFQVGSYERIGRQVTVRFAIQLSGWTGSPAGAVTITGLPVASANVTNDYGACFLTNYSVSALAGGSQGLVGYVAPNSSVITLLSNGNTASQSVTAAVTGTTPALFGYCSYHT